MGQIYSRAVRVVAWLGCCPRLTQLLHVFSAASAIFSTGRCFSDDTRIMFQAEGFAELRVIRPVELAWRCALCKGGGGHRLVWDNKYWSRVWISQEIALAKRLQLLSGHCEIDVIALTGMGGPRETYRSGHDINRNFNMYMSMVKGETHLKYAGLINQLFDLPVREGLLIRNRAYSVLSLASEGPQIAVDYGSSDLEVIGQMMRACANSLYICSAGIIAHDLWQKSALATEPEVDAVRPRLDIVIKISSFVPLRKVRSMACPSTSNFHECSTCKGYLPNVWEPKRRLLFCLKQICPATLSHILFSEDHGTLSYVS